MSNPNQSIKELLEEEQEVSITLFKHIKGIQTISNKDLIQAVLPVLRKVLKEQRKAYKGKVITPAETFLDDLEELVK